MMIGKQMVEEIASNLFRLRIPLPETPLKYLNAYLVRSPERNLLIDTGLNHEACLTAMEDGLRRIGADLNRTDIFITHLHADHFALVSKLAAENTRVLFNRPDTEIIESWKGFDAMIAYGGRQGFPMDLLKKALDAHPGSKFGTDWVPGINILDDGQELTCGDYRFACLETPGHTPGHMCLYEADKKILVAGDHILIDITPNIQCWSDQGNPLKSYLASLKKVYTLDVDLVLPGHRRLFSDHRRRIDELTAHHEERLSEVTKILDGSPLSAYETASRMTWDIKADTWAEYPVAQQWFATGEAISHLRYLEADGRIQRIVDDGLTRYAPV